MSIFVAIVGLGLLILIHEAGHFFVSLAVGLRPRKFYIGFPPALVRIKKRGIEYGVGVIPLGGFVSIPGMHRPIPHDAERRFSPAVSETPALGGPVDRVKRALESGDVDAGVAALDDFEHSMRQRKLSPGAATVAAKGLTELRDALGPDAYWKAPTWKRLVVIAAGPVANIVLSIILFALLYMTVAATPSQTIASVIADSPAAAAGLRSGDRVVAIDGAQVSGDGLGKKINGSQGKSLTITVVRDGQEVTLPPVAPERTGEGYRLGIVRKGVALSPLAAVKRSFEVTGILSREIVKSLGRLVTSEGREQVASPIGITQASSDAVERGVGNYVWVLGVISLSLALLNLLPLLPLDGGHILFTLIEGARGKFVRREVYERVSVVGLAIVLLLFFVGVSNDIGRLS